MHVLSEPEWRSRQAAHRQRVERWTIPHRQRQLRGEKHPVMDFMWTYYSFRPSRLERWQPGVGVVLAGGQEFLDRRGFTQTADGVALDPAALTPKRRDTCEFIRGLLRATASRKPRPNCSDLHVGPLVLRPGLEETRRADRPQRRGRRGTQ